MNRRTRDNSVITRPSPIPNPLGPILERAFYTRDAATVARDLLGRVIQHGECAGKIVETEAYLGLHDGAAHAARGITPRTRVIFGAPGHAYIYLIYGIHECLNLVCEPEGAAGCVLIRALEPLTGLDRMRERRGRQSVRELTSGPGKLTLAMGITREHNGADVTHGNLVVREGDAEPFAVAVTPRIGITACADWPLRFVIAGNRFASVR